MNKLRWIVARFVIALALYFVLYTSLNVSLTHRVEGQLAQGRPFTSHELERRAESIPEKEDAGPAFRAACEFWDARQERWNESGFVGIEMEDGKLVQTDTPVLESGSSPALEAEEIDRLRRQIAGDEILSRLLDEIVARPRCSTKLDFGEGPALLLPHIASARGLSGYCRIKGALAATDAEFPRAADHLAESLALARCVSGDRFLLISHLVFLSIERETHFQLLKLLDAFDFDEPSLARLQAEMGRLPDLRQSWSDAMIGERSMFGSIFDAFLNGKTYPSNPFGRQAHGFARLLLLADYSVYLASFPSDLDAQQLLEKGGDGRPEIPSHAILTRLLSPTWDQISKTTLGLSIERRMVRTAIELRRHRISTGSYPETLDGLVPPAGFPEPIDPTSGDPLVYERRGEGFRLTVGNREFWWSTRYPGPFDRGEIVLTR